MFSVLTLTVGLSLAASPWANSEADVVAEITVNHPKDAVWERLSDLKGYAELMPEDCGRDFIYVLPTVGLGAQMRYTHIAGPWRRHLDASYTLLDRDAGVIDLDHTGRRGFVSRFTVQSSSPDRTTVTLRSYVAAPVWPLQAYYFRKVQPAWTRCQQALLDGLQEPSARRDPPPVEDALR